MLFWKHTYMITTWHLKQRFRRIFHGCNSNSSSNILPRDKWNCCQLCACNITWNKSIFLYFNLKLINQSYINFTAEMVKEDQTLLKNHFVNLHWKFYSQRISKLQVICIWLANMRRWLSIYDLTKKTKRGKINFYLFSFTFF